MKDEIKITLIQMEVKADAFEPAIIDQNDVKVIELVDKATQSKPDLIILPDEFTGGYGYGPMNIPRDFDTPVIAQLQERAKEHGCYIAGALLGKEEVITSFSTGFLIGPDGGIVGKQSRIHTLYSEARFVINGEELEVFDTSFGKVGFAIGLDLLYPEVSRILSQKGAEIILSPSFFHGTRITSETDKLVAYPHNFFQTAALARAMENQVFVVLVNAVGTHFHSEQPLLGGSLVVTPTGLFEAASDQEEIFTSTLSSKHFELRELKEYNLNERRQEDTINRIIEILNAESISQNA